VGGGGIGNLVYHGGDARQRLVVLVGQRKALTNASREAERGGAVVEAAGVAWGVVAGPVGEVERAAAEGS